MNASVTEKQASATTRPTRKRPFVVAGLGVLLVVAVIIWCAYSLLFRGVNPGPSLIDELRAGTIAKADIKSIEILRFDPGAGWPFSEPEYARKARKRIGAAATRKLIGILTSASTNGHKYRNHPATFYDGILRVDLVRGGHFYVFYSLGYYNNRYYAYVDANSKNSTNPNGTDAYENIPLAGFLKRYDPWYRNLDSPTTWRRPSFPDDVP